jgi:hypothetical protein
MAMKHHQIELQKLKSATSTHHGEVVIRVDALVSAQPAPRDDDAEPSSVLRMSEATARVLQALLKNQLLEFDKRKARSQR